MKLYKTTAYDDSDELFFCLKEHFYIKNSVRKGKLLCITSSNSYYSDSWDAFFRLKDFKEYYFDRYTIL